MSETVISYTCSQCGGVRADSDAPARLIRHSDECTCILCEECGAAIGDDVESVEWNQQQKLAHDQLVHEGVCLEHHVHEQVEKVQSLAAKVQFLVDWVDKQGLLADHCFTFEDGDVWTAEAGKSKSGNTMYLVANPRTFMVYKGLFGTWEEAKQAMDRGMKEPYCLTAKYVVCRVTAVQFLPKVKGD